MKRSLTDEEVLARLKQTGNETIEIPTRPTLEGRASVEPPASGNRISAGMPPVRSRAADQAPTAGNRAAQVPPLRGQAQTPKPRITKPAVYGWRVASVAMVMAVALLVVLMPATGKAPENPAITPPPGSVFSAPSDIIRTDPAGKYKGIVDALPELSTYRNGWEGYVDFPAEADDAGITSSGLTFEKSAETMVTDSSEVVGTNLQILGVDEADFIKTDGRYLYILGGDWLYTVDTTVRPLQVLAKQTYRTLKDSTASWQGLPDMYVIGNRLVLVGNGLSGVLPMSYGYYDDGAAVDCAPSVSDNNTQKIMVFDISDPANPIKINELSQSGNYVTSRMVGGYLYTFTQYWVQGQYDKADPATFVPILTGEVCQTMAARDLCIAEEPAGAQYIIMTALNIETPTDFTASKAAFGYNNVLHVGLQNIYLASVGTVTEKDTHDATTVLRYAFQDGTVELAATGQFPGMVSGQFAADEFAGTLRVATMVNHYKANPVQKTHGLEKSFWNQWVSQDNALYVLDMDMQIVGSVENMAPGETIRSVRFDGEIGYIVTFRQTDPLFAVDLKDPAHPVVLSELKIPGFSSYLHAFGKGKLVGLGFDGDWEGRMSGRLKLSMFDVTDKTDVREAFSALLPADVTYAEATDNHKAVYANVERGLIGLYAQGQYLVYSIGENKFVESAAVKLNFVSQNGSAHAVSISDTLYICGERGVRAVSLVTFEAEETLVF